MSYVYRYMFDEPSSYLDVRQRLKAAQTIRDLCTLKKYVGSYLNMCIFVVCLYATVFSYCHALTHIAY